MESGDCDDAFGDLGLGRGLQPGAVWRRNCSRSSDPQWKTTLASDDDGRSTSASSLTTTDLCVCCRRRWQSNNSSSNRSSNSYCHHRRGNRSEDNVAARSSSLLRPQVCQAAAAATEVGQKTLQEDGRRRNETDRVLHSSADDLSYAATKVKLQFAEEEVEELKQDLELCRMQLCAKCQATKILQEQLAAVKSEKEILSNRLENRNKTLIQELNRVQFELRCHESKLLESQEKWSEKFDSICLENLRMASDLEKQVLKQRKLYAEKMALSRERDELLALLNVQERNKYESVNPSSADSDTFDEFTSFELALLGACHCHSESLDPCACALTAACLKKEIFRGKEEMEQLRQERDDAFAMADIYRIAFDDQLSSNRGLIRQIAEICKEMDDQSSGCHEKFKSSIARLLRKEDNHLSCSNSENSDSVPANMEHNVDRMDELMKHLEETVVDKSEALAHQKFAARLLAVRVRQLEEKLSVMHNDEISSDLINKCEDDVS